VAFHAIVGNPPWVLYAGKGKQPIDAREEAALKTLFGRAASTLSTHGCFAAQAGRLVREQGRVGLVMPTSLADAGRYEDARAGHEATCAVDDALPDFGEDAFVGVFQPSFGLISTRRSAIDESAASGVTWKLSRPGVPSEVICLLEKLDALPKVPAELFGERGYRSCKADEGAFCKAGAPTVRFSAPLYEGTSVREYELDPPTAFADPDALPEVTRTEKWAAVDLFIRQTARYPIACLSARKAFRNSILAGFAKPPWTAVALLAYLNSAPVRWYHFHKQRDAQQGMPQVKISHLRALPCPSPATIAELAAQPCPPDRASVDAALCAGLGLSHDDVAAITAWNAANPPPNRRDRGERR